MKKGIVFGIIALVVLVLGVVGGVMLVRQNQDFREKAAPATTVYTSPVTQTKKQSENFTVFVEMDTSTNLVTGIDVRLTFDPNAIEIISLQKGSGISNLDSIITNDFSNTAGTIAYAVFTIDKTKAVTGNGVQVLVINGKIKDNAVAGTTRFNFNSATSASGVDEGQNILIGLTSGSIVVSENSTAPTPTQVSTPTSTSSSNSTNSPTATSTSTSTSNPTTTSKATATSGSTSKSAVATATATPFPIPVTGVEWPAMLSVILGISVIVGSLLLVF